MPKVLIVDDYAIVRAGVRETLHQLLGAEFDEAATGAEAILKIERSDWDIVLLDINLPDMTGVELARAIRQTRPEQKILALSAQSAEKYALLMLRVGAHGYLSKDSLGADLVQAVKKVCAGERYVQADLARFLAEDTHLSTAPHHLLSPREYEIFSHVCRGKKTTVLARELHLSPKTISTYKTRILEKMNMQSSSDLVYYAIKEGLIVDDEFSE